MKTQNLIFGTLLLTVIIVLTACTTPTGKASSLGDFRTTTAADGNSYQYYRGDADGDGYAAPGDIAQMDLVIAGSPYTHCYALGHGFSQTGPFVELNCTTVLEMNNDNKVDVLDKTLLQKAFTMLVVDCGNSICDPGENSTTCWDDCIAGECGNNVCESGEQGQCFLDCAPDTCGNGICDGGQESSRNCQSDCCGNGNCDSGDKNYCPADCGKVSKK